MPLKSMKKSIKEQDKMNKARVEILLILTAGLFQSGCSLLKTPKNIQKDTKIFSCEEEAKPKSLQYLEQQYRCTTNK